MSDDDKQAIRGDDLAEDAAGGGAQPAGGVMGGDGIRGDGLADAAGATQDRTGAADDEPGEDGIRGDGLAKDA